MNKTDFTKLLSKQTGYPYSVCKKVLHESKNLIATICFKGENVTFRGFGKFFLKQHFPRRTFNPQTKRYYMSKNKIFVDFVPAKKIAK